MPNYVDICLEDFANRVRNLLKEKGADLVPAESACLELDGNWDLVKENILKLTPVLVQDFSVVSGIEKMEVGFDNPFEVLPNSFGLYRDKKVSFLGGWLKLPDGKFPLFFMVYWDGESLRAYIPEKGNLWDEEMGLSFDMVATADFLPLLARKYGSRFGEILVEERESWEDSKIVMLNFSDIWFEIRMDFKEGYPPKKVDNVEEVAGWLGKEFMEEEGYSEEFLKYLIEED